MGGGGRQQKEWNYKRESKVLVLERVKRDGTKNTGIREMTTRDLESVIQEEAGQDHVKKTAGFWTFKKKNVDDTFLQL